MNIRVSVIIATYNRAHILGECLQSLAEQNVSGDAFEVIVVDNNSTDNTEEVVAAFENRVPGLRLIKEPRQGAGHARNAGMAAARYNWIACLDSDAKAHSDWIHIILDEINKGNFDCFGGPYLAWHRYGPPPSWFAPEWGSSVAIQKHYGVLPNDRYPTSGSCAFTKALAEAVGGFPTEIGMTGGKCSYGEETLLFRRMREWGATLGFVPHLLIDHCVLPYKYTMRWHFTSLYAHGRDAPIIFDFPVSWWMWLKTCWHLCKSLVKSPLPFVREWRAGGWRRGVLHSLNPVLTAGGSVITMTYLLLFTKR